jgi:hypothetical protein
MTELLVHPYRESDEQRMNEYCGLLSSFPNLDCVAPDLAVADEAARVGARHRLRTPDERRRHRASHQGGGRNLRPTKGKPAALASLRKVREVSPASIATHDIPATPPSHQRSRSSIDAPSTALSKPHVRRGRTALRTNTKRGRMRNRLLRVIRLGSPLAITAPFENNLLT